MSSTSATYGENKVPVLSFVEGKKLEVISAVYCYLIKNIFSIIEHESLIFVANELYLLQTVQKKK